MRLLRRQLLQAQMAAHPTSFRNRWEGIFAHSSHPLEQRSLTGGPKACLAEQALMYRTHSLKVPLSLMKAPFSHCPVYVQEVGPCQDNSQMGACKHPIPSYWNNMCSFRQDVGGGWASYMICDEERQRAIVKYIR